MSEKLKIPSGGKVIIEINSPPEIQNPKSKIQNAKGLIQVRHEDDYLPRRLKSDIYLNFYDFGQYTEDAGATWLDFDYQIKPIIIPAFGGNVTNLSAMSISDWNVMVDIVFDTPQDDWKTIFRKFSYEKAERYGVDVYLGDMFSFEADKYFPVARNASRRNIKAAIQSSDVADSKWTEQGLLVPKQTEPNFKMFAQNGFMNIWDSIKITNEPNYLADPVEFIIDRSCDFYMFPAPVVESGSYYAGDGFDWLNLLYTQLPRSLFIDDDDQWNATEWLKTPMVTRRINYFGAATANTNRIAQLMKDRYEARIYSSGGKTETPGSSGFPLSGDVSYTMTTVHGFSMSDALATVRVGSMLMAAKKGSEWFYFYSDTDRTNGQPGAVPASFRFTV